MNQKLLRIKALYANGKGGTSLQVARAFLTALQRNKSTERAQAIVNADRLMTRRQVISQG